MFAQYFVLIGVFITSAMLTGVIRLLALSGGLLDVPNARSSHRVPMPRGGGMAIVLTVLVAVAVLYRIGTVAAPLAHAILGGGALVSLIGFVDDFKSVLASVRLIFHCIAVIWVLVLLGSLPPIDFGIFIVNLGFIGTMLAIAFLVWFVNLFNFMDGIDGIASVEAGTAAIAGAILLLMHGGEPSTAYVLLIVAASVCGFVLWNWPPARIFMGDAGSGFLGFAIGTLAWETIVASQLSIWVWLILLGVFIIDATLTLVRRILRGAVAAEAHRSHAYQRLSRNYRSHRAVTVGVLCVNVLWLSPIAYAAVLHPSLGAALTFVAWGPLVVVAWRVGAGLSND